MTQEQWQQAWSLISELRDLPDTDQQAVLAARDVHPDVLDHVRAVLACEDAQEERESTAVPDESYGTYQPIRLLGEGAMGSVYLARQDKPLKRTVALKVIRPGVRSREVLERFEIERRALAMMDHPNIARVFDAGQTQRGTPYFAMEYVPGVEITKYCELYQTPLTGKLELIISACEAIQHAHQKGIVHRDIKPSNVLVSDQNSRPVLKIIDFGIARAIEDAGLDTLGTNFGSFVGTLAYMSPEQAAHDASQLDTRCDVYSLGVLAYQLLTGSTPLRDTTIHTGYSNLPDLLERIRLEDAEPPSRRAPAMAAELSGDLDWILLKALEKEPARRYPSASSFAEDLRRYLHGDPVEAAPPSTTYRLKKLARRHRLPLVTAAAFVAVLAVATGVSLWLAVRASNAEALALASRDRAIRSEAEAVASRDEAQRAEKQARAEQSRAVAAERQSQVERDRALAESRRADLQATTTRAVVDFLQNDLLKVADATMQANLGVASPTRDIKVREALDRAATSIGDRFRNQPEVEAEIRNTIGSTYFNLGILPAAKQQLEAAYALRKSSRGEFHPETLDSLHGIAMVLRAEGRSVDAAEVFRQVVAARQRVLGPEHPRTLQAMHSVAVALRSAGKTDEASSLHDTVWQARKRVLGMEHPDTLRSGNDLAVSYIYSGRAATGLPLAEQVLQLRSKVLGPEHPDTAVSMQVYGMGLFSTGQPDKSLPILLRSYELNVRLRGRDHTTTLDNAGTIGNAYDRLFRYEDAARYSTIAADGYERQFGNRHPTGINWRVNTAAALQNGGRFEEAITLLRSRLPRWIEVRGSNDTSVRQAQYILAKNLLWAGKPAEALEISVPLLAARIREWGATREAIVPLVHVVAQAYVRTGRLREAEAAYLQILEARLKAKSSVSSLQTGLAEVLLRQGRISEAEELVRSLLPKEHSTPDWNTSYLQGILGAILTSKSEYLDAEKLLLPARETMAGLRSRTHAPEWYQLELVREWIAVLYQKQGKPDPAARLVTGR